MQAQEVAAGRRGLHLLDVREQEEWDEGHIEGSQHIPLGELGDRLAEVPTDKAIVCVCKAGFRSDRAAQGLAGLGFNAENLDGGVEAWMRTGLPLVTADGKPGRVR